MRNVRCTMITVCLLLIFSLGACSSPTTEPASALPEPVGVLDEDLVSANTLFAFNLLRELQHMDAEGDKFFSPASVSVALAMTYNGAEGDTFDAMAQTLGFGQMSLDRVNRGFSDLLTILRNPDPELEVAIANSIWAREGMPFKEEFLEANREYYNAETRELDFDDPGAVDTINAWVDEITRGNIDELIEEIRADSIMFLINAIYFQGSWTEEFDPDLTREEPFYRQDGAIDVPFMHREGTYRYYEDERLQAVALPYGEERVSMHILLPQEGYGMHELIEELDPETWREIVTGLSERKIQLALPRFTLEYEVTLDDALKAMGMEIAFDRQRADFSAMYPVRPGENVFIGEVLHKAFVDVNEEGTEAAAATSVEIRIESAPMLDTFRADRPFLFAIVDDTTSSILFLGTLNGQNF